jgi:hypothetical protein
MIASGGEFLAIIGAGDATADATAQTDPMMSRDQAPELAAADRAPVLWPDLNLARLPDMTAFRVWDGGFASTDGVPERDGDLGIPLESSEGRMTAAEDPEMAANWRTVEMAADSGRSPYQAAAVTPTPEPSAPLLLASKAAASADPGRVPLLPLLPSPDPGVSPGTSDEERDRPDGDAPRAAVMSRPAWREDRGTVGFAARMPEGEATSLPPTAAPTAPKDSAGTPMLQPIEARGDASAPGAGVGPSTEAKRSADSKGAAHAAREPAVPGSRLADLVPYGPIPEGEVEYVSDSYLKAAPRLSSIPSDPAAVDRYQSGGRQVIPEGYGAVHVRMAMQMPVPAAAAQPSAAPRANQSGLPASPQSPPAGVSYEEVYAWGRSTAVHASPPVPPFAQPLTEMEPALPGDEQEPLPLLHAVDLTGVRKGLEAPPAGVASAPAELARNVGVQLAATVSVGAEGTFEIQLSPEELGRVTLTLQMADDSIVLSVVAERQETLDLMRRHADVLQREFREAGFTSFNFSFGQGQSGGRPQRTSGEAPTHDEGGAGPSAPRTLPEMSHASGLPRVDLRL